MNDIFLRSKNLLGKETFKKIEDFKIALFGLGGVGGTALEALARTGFSNFIICDFDVVDPSNLNRQILYNSNDIGKSKVGCAKEHILAINPNAKIDVIEEKISANTDLNFLLDVDYVIDCIDDVNGKFFIAKMCEENHIPLIMSTGMANKLDIGKLYLTTLNKTEYDPLAKKLRIYFKQNGLNINLIKVVSSKEVPKKDGCNLNSIITVPSAAGLYICECVISYLIDGEN